MNIADKLKPHVPAILAAHNAGDGSATAIIKLYEMHRSCPGDPAAIALCEAAFDDWMKSRSSISSPSTHDMGVVSHG